MSDLHVEVLRLFEGSSYQEDWHTIGDSGYTTQDIEKIKDPASGTSKEITSIPSPFARINLFEHAFKAVNNAAKTELNSLNDNTMFHKLVSECLDVGEIFFNYQNYIEGGNTIDVLTWNKQRHLQELKDSSFDKQRLLGDTLELFLNQDREGSGFDRIDNIHILQCEYRVVGGTSPSTLFFGGYNDNYILSSLDLRSGNDLLFDQFFYPLHQRSLNYQRFLHGLFKVYPRLQRQMPLFHDYLRQSLRILEVENKDSYKTLQDFLRNPKYTVESYNNEFEELTVGRANTILDISKDIYLRRKGEVIVDSDFSIKADFPDTKIENKVPLVLVNGFRKNFNYFNGTWDPSTPVPFAPENVPEDRLLPGQSDRYPYLTVSDFLEPTLIQLEFRINNDRFFDGNPQNFSMGNQADFTPPDPSFLLPIKPLFFQYFSVDTLRGVAPDGKPTFRMSKIGADSVSVELRIPIAKKGECIVLERIYRQNSNSDETNNEGNIVEYQMNAGFLPLVKGGNSFYQQVGLVDNDILGDTMSNDYDLEFIQQGNPLPIKPSKKIKKSDKRTHNRNATTKYYILNEEYDVVVVDTTNARGVIVPNFRKVRTGGRMYNFSVDFGTTNTHVEYSVDGGPPIPFSIEQDDLQLITLVEPNSDWYFSGFTRDMFYHEFIPDFIGRGHRYNFPIRTVSTEIENLDHNTSPSPIADVNISFVYEKWAILKNSHIERNLKWQNFDPLLGAPARSRLRSFLGELLILIRNKVLMNGGDLDQTRLIWFSPSSMDNAQVQAFNRIWTDLFHEYINDKNTPVRYSEAVVPFYTHQKVNANLYPVASIDIGGGTTDFAIFNKKSPLFISSAKFAGNSVWGDGFLDQPDSRNGIVRVFRNVVSQFLESNKEDGLYQLAATFEQLVNDHRFTSSDIMSFFFSIDRNSDVLERGHRLEFSRKLAEYGDFKIVFLVFFMGIIYYLARLMHMLGLEMPRYITLNGNGSKIINLLDPDPRFNATEKLAKFIFEYVYRRAYYEDGLSIVQSSEPKEATCKGGLRRLNQKLEENEYDSLIWLGDAGTNRDDASQEDVKQNGYREELGTVVNPTRVKYPANNLKYSYLSDESKDSAIEEYKRFLRLISMGHDELNFRNLFGVRAERLEQYMNILRRDSRTNLAQGLAKRLEITDSNETIVESLFFYPLIGGIYALMEEIAAEVTGE